jgi:hypothetical protein
MNLLGGPIAAGWVHRFAATALAALYVGLRRAARLARRPRARGRPVHGGRTRCCRGSRTCKDLWATLRWFAFRGPRPRYDRWTYWEKFDFWAAFWGLVVIGLSGLMLWFPEAATRVVPGWVLNAAVIVHGHEAQLVIAFIFTVHVFHANLRPDKFPIDTAFLTGRLTRSSSARTARSSTSAPCAPGTLEALLDRAAEPPAHRGGLHRGRLCARAGLLLPRRHDRGGARHVSCSSSRRSAWATTSEPEPTRREFVDLMVAGALGMTAIAAIVPAVSYLVPPEGGEAQTASTVLPFAAEELPANSGRIFKFGSKPALVVKTAGGEMRAFSRSARTSAASCSTRPPSAASSATATRAGTT